MAGGSGTGTADDEGVFTDAVGEENTLPGVLVLWFHLKVRSAGEGNLSRSKGEIGCWVGVFSGKTWEKGMNEDVSVGSFQ